MKDRPRTTVDPKRRRRLDEVERAWIEEVQRRVERVERGVSPSVDYADAMARARQKIRRRPQ